jgi:hypothetical protein
MKRTFELVPGDKVRLCDKTWIVFAVERTQSLHGCHNVTCQNLRGEIRTWLLGEKEEVTIDP